MVSKLYSVKEMMALTQLSRKQLFYYEEKGFLGEVLRNETNNYRYYTEAQLSCLNFIKECRVMGIALKDAKELLGNKQPAFLRQVVKRSVRNAKQEFNRAIRQYERSIENYNKLLEASYIWENQSETCGEISLIDLPERDIVAYEYEGLFFNDTINFCKEFPHLGKIINDYQLSVVPPRMFCFDGHFDAASGEFNREKHKISLMYELSEPQPNCPHCRKLPAQTAVSAVSVGNYEDDLVVTYQKLWSWAGQHGYELQNISYEEALLDPSYAHDESSIWISRVSIPLKVES